MSLTRIGCCGNRIDLGKNLLGLTPLIINYTDAIRFRRKGVSSKSNDLETQAG